MLLTTLVSCGQGGNAANAPASLNKPIEILDNAALAELRSSFLEVSGSDRIEFASGSAALTPKARFRLERQALWLNEHDYVAIRFRSESASAKGVGERRLAVRRANVVQAYLKDFGVEDRQFVGIDIEFGSAGTVTTLIDPFHFGRPDARQALNEMARGPS
jgi:outer membrane protein OmpA-like peptidoglycan-associated protein